MSTFFFLITCSLKINLINEEERIPILKHLSIRRKTSQIPELLTSFYRSIVSFNKITIIFLTYGIHQ